MMMRMRGSWRRLATWSVLVVLGLTVTVVVLGTIASARLRASNPPPGELIDVGGYRLHLHCVGTGEPTVLLEAGLLDFSVVWSQVQAGVGTVTRTCAYDRAGSGWSEPSEGPRTSDAMVNELQTLLSRAELRGPFVLVGHSFGGMNVRLMAHRYPEQVAGVVLVDGAHEEQWERLPELARAGDALAGQFRLLGWFARSGMLAFAPDRIPDRGLPTVDARRYRGVLASTKYFHTVAREVAAVRESAAQLQGVERRGPLNMPVVVISRGRPAPLPGLSLADQERMEVVWGDLQRELATEATDREQVFATRSGHDIHLQQPELVVEVVRRMVLKSRLAPSGGSGTLSN